jgi:hypothetical protein
MVALDDVLPMGGRVDFIKIDVQGFEMNVLKGCRRVLMENRDISILLEFWPFGLRQASVDPSEVLEFTKALGFSAFEASASDHREFDPLRLDFDSAKDYTNLLLYRAA